MSYVLDGIETAMRLDTESEVARPYATAEGVRYERWHPIACPCGWSSLGLDENALRFHYLACPKAKNPEKPLHWTTR